MLRAGKGEEGAGKPHAEGLSVRKAPGRRLCVAEEHVLPPRISKQPLSERRTRSCFGSVAGEPDPPQQ